MNRLKKDTPLPTKMLVIGGSDDDFIATASVEIFDLADQGNECPPLPDMPYPRVGMEAALTQEDQVLVCGGYDGEEYLSECIRFDFSLGAWLPDSSMDRARFEADSVYFQEDGGSLLIAGGRESKESFLGDGERYLDGSWSPEPGLQLPTPRNNHCLLRLDGATLLLIGGYEDTDGGITLDDTYLYDLNSQEWTQLDSMAVPKYAFGCGFVTDPEGRREVVVQWPFVTEVLSLETLEWREVEPFPADLTDSGTGQLEGTLAVLGGNGDGSRQDTVYLFDLVTYEWSLLEERLGQRRREPGVVPIPDRLLDC